MKETFGTAFMLRLVIVIIVILVAFLCLVFSIGRAFRVKNGVIDIIEQYQGVNTKSLPLIENYINKMGYSCVKGSYTNPRDYVLMVNDNNNLVKTDNDGYYNVQVCIDWDIPVINSVGNWVIKGRTEVISNVFDNGY